MNNEHWAHGAFVHLASRFDIVNIKEYTCCSNMAQLQMSKDVSASCHCRNLYEIQFCLHFCSEWFCFRFANAIWVVCKCCWLQGTFLAFTYLIHVWDIMLFSPVALTLMKRNISVHRLLDTIHSHNSLKILPAENRSLIVSKLRPTFDGIVTYC